jgi:hypothetical protein
LGLKETSKTKKCMIDALCNANAKTKTSQNVILLKIQILCKVIEEEQTQKLISKLSPHNLNPIRNQI